jgi:hypothetical protein
VSDRFGGEEDSYPQPEAHWDAFIERIAAENALHTVWSPLYEGMRPWINMEALLELKPNS